MTKKNKIYVVGIGPGSSETITPQALNALKKSDAVVGYKLYLKLIEQHIEGKELCSSGMKKEYDRALEAFHLAEEDKTVAVISSGDAGVYGMASLMLEMKYNLKFPADIEVIPGISAMFGAASRLGAPLGHDFCSISLSDLLTPWEIIEKRIEAAAMADFVTSVYNPVSNERFWQLERLKEIFLKHRCPLTPVGIASEVGRVGEKILITTLNELSAEMADMFTVIIIGNSQTKSFDNVMFTPRGYFNKEEEKSDNPGRQIMNESFRTILSELDSSKYSREHLWLALHGIHTTADFSVADSLCLTNNVVEDLHKKFYSGNPPVIVTDVRMVTNGIRKAIVEKLGIKLLCYLDDERTINLAKEKNITRTQAGIQLAVSEHPNAMYVFGNAPTALMELTKYIRLKKASPMGVVAAPVGFVNVRQSKWGLKFGCKEIPSIIVEGRKGGSNLAATIINAILSWEEAHEMNPGRGL